MGVWDEPHSARGMRQHDATSNSNDSEPRPSHDTPHNLLYLTPTTITVRERLATVIAVYAATDADGGLVWRVETQPEGTRHVEEQVVVEYRRAVGHPCPVAVRDRVRVPR